MAGVSGSPKSPQSRGIAGIGREVTQSASGKTEAYRASAGTNVAGEPRVEEILSTLWQMERDGLIEPAITQKGRLRLLGLTPVVLETKCNELASDLVGPSSAGNMGADPLHYANVGRVGDPDDLAPNAKATAGAHTPGPAPSFMGTTILELEGMTEEALARMGQSPESPTSRVIAGIGVETRDTRQSARSLTADAVRDDGVVHDVVVLTDSPQGLKSDNFAGLYRRPEGLLHPVSSDLSARRFVPCHVPCPQEATGDCAGDGKHERIFQCELCSFTACVACLEIHESEPHVSDSDTMRERVRHL